MTDLNKREQKSTNECTKNEVKDTTIDFKYYFSLLEVRSVPFVFFFLKTGDAFKCAHPHAGVSARPLRITSTWAAEARATVPFISSAL